MMRSPNLSKKSLSWEMEGKRNPHSSWEEFLKSILTTFTEASYEIAVKCGFRGTFLHFLSDFQESVQNLFQRSGWENIENLFSFQKKKRKGIKDRKATHRIH